MLIDNINYSYRRKCRIQIHLLETEEIYITSEIIIDRSGIENPNRFSQGGSLEARKAKSKSDIFPASI